MFSIAIPEAEQATYTSVEVNANGITVITKQLNGLVLDTFTITADADKETTHSPKTENAKEVTCKEDGYTGDKICAGCGELIEQGSVIPHSDSTHREKLVGAESESCGEDGYTGDKVCKDCNKLLEKGSVKPATGAHTFRSWMITKPATETEAGEKTRKCLICEAVETAEIPKLGSENSNNDAAPGDTNTDTDDVIDDTEADEVEQGGCGSSVAGGAAVLAIALTLGVATCRKKKDE